MNDDWRWECLVSGRWVEWPGLSPTECGKVRGGWREEGGGGHYILQQPGHSVSTARYSSLPPHNNQTHNSQTLLNSTGTFHQ